MALSHSPKRGRIERRPSQGDIVDLFLEMVWYRRPQHLSQLEQQYSILIMSILVCIWYSAAIGAITTSKKLMLTIKVPYTLCAFQFLCATIITGITKMLCTSHATILRKDDYDRPQDDMGGDLEGGEYHPNNNHTSQRRNVAMMPLSSLNKDHHIAPTQSGEVRDLCRQYEASSWKGREKGQKALKRHRSFSAHNGDIKASYGHNNDENKQEDSVFDSEKHSTHSFFNIFPLPLTHPYTWLLLATAISYTCGFLFTNLAFSIVSASFAETIKSGEPISSVFLGYLILKEKNTVLTYFTLIPIVFGVALSCISDTSLHVVGAIFAFLSNICFSLRAVLAKKMLVVYPGSMDTFTLFGHISFIGVAILIPLAYIWEKDILYADLIQTVDTAFIDGRISMGLLFLYNGLAYTTYNIVSFMVLNRSNIVTHAVLNCFRRVFIIICTSYYFDVPLTYSNLMGVGIAVVGVIMFGISKHYANAKQAIS